MLLIALAEEEAAVLSLVGGRAIVDGWVDFVESNAEVKDIRHI